MIVREMRRSDATACEAIVRALPDWFGIEEGIEEARGYLDAHDGFVAEESGRITGFVTFASEFPESVEITWMAVAPDAHRLGIGRSLIEALLEESLKQGYEIVLVKTLADFHPSPEYAATRAFYAAMGFRRLAVLPELWDPANPCLVMVRMVVPDLDL